MSRHYTRTTQGCPGNLMFVYHVASSFKVLGHTNVINGGCDGGKLTEQTGFVKHYARYRRKYTSFLSEYFSLEPLCNHLREDGKVAKLQPAATPPSKLSLANHAVTLLDLPANVVAVHLKSSKPLQLFCATEQ